MKLLNQTRTLLTIIFFGVFLSACSEAPKSIVLSGPTMGTSYNVKYVLEEAHQPSVEEVQSKITQILEQVNAEMSTYRADSELSQFNQHDTSMPFSVSNNTAKVVSEAIRLNAITEGALDVTVGPLVNLWGFGPKARPDKIPTEDELLKVRAQTGLANLSVIGNRLQKSIPNLYVDLSSIAKGHGVDQVAAYLDSVHIHNYMVEVGGEIKANGKNQDGVTWRIAIEKPVATDRSVELVIELDNMSVATSGDYRNYFEQDGKRYSHIINPMTGYPITNNVVSVSVLKRSNMTADGLATAFMVLGAEKGLEIANQQKYPVLFIVKTDEGFEELPSEAFKPYLNAQN